jgi:hypothetical protein
MINRRAAKDAETERGKRVLATDKNQINTDKT